MTDEEKVGRVNMQWPADLKKQVQNLVGTRGLTTFTLQAVRDRLAKTDAEKRLASDLEGLQHELGEARDLAQLLADRCVMNYEDRRAALMEVDLPPWLATDGWPDDIAEMVPKGEHQPKVVKADEPVTLRNGESVTVQTEAIIDEGSDDLHRPMFMTGSRKSGKSPAPPSEQALEAAGNPRFELPKQAEGGAPGSAGDGVATTSPSADKTMPFDLPHDTQGDDLLARIADKAREKGVTREELAQAKLKPASQIKPPAKSTAVDEPVDKPSGSERAPSPSEPEVPTEPAPDLEVQADAASPDTCPQCKDELINGECWTCA